MGMFYVKSGCLVFRLTKGSLSNLIPVYFNTKSHATLKDSWLFKFVRVNIKQDSRF